MSAIAASGLSVSFGGNPVLRDLDLEVPRGAITAILGNSGAGKTTLLRSLAGLVKPDKGQVDRPARHSPAICFQEPRLLLRLSALDNVILGGLARYPAWRTVFGTPGTLRIAALAALQSVGLGAIANNRADRLSGGQRQRVALARTLLSAEDRGGDLILCDEPTAHLDPTATREVLGVLDGLRRTSGLAILLSTHSTDVALGLADRITFLQAGRIRFAAPAAACTPDTLARLFAEARDESRSC